MIAGLNRKRKNAATGEGLDDFPKPEGRVGRPSKGGDLIRSKRYYFKNHLKILQRRKLRRYITTVKKLVVKHLYDSASLKKELETICSIYKFRDNKSISYNIILRAVDLGREDRYLGFLNEEAVKILAGIPNSKNFEQNDVEIVLANLASKHITRLFQLSTLWSAFLIIHYAENKHADEPEDVKFQNIKDTVEDRYIHDYSHLKGEELPDGFIQNRSNIEVKEENDEEEN